jgi:hypothetical protein
MSNEANPDHRAIGWAAIGGTLAGIGAPSGVALAIWGASSHLWGDDYFLAGFAFACLLTTVGVYVLVAEFIGNVGPITLRLPPTRYEREAKRPASEGGLRVVIPPRPAIPQSGEVRPGNVYRRTMTYADTMRSQREAELSEQREREAQQRQRDAAQARAEVQLATALRSGHVLRGRGHGQSALGLQWYSQVETLIKEMFGELEASRLNTRRGLEGWIKSLDDLAGLAQSRRLTPSNGWDAYVERMAGFRQDLKTDVNEGEGMRGEVFSEARVDLKQTGAKVTSWLEKVDRTFSSVSELRGLPSSDRPAGMQVVYTGLSEKASAVAWRLEHRLEELVPTLAVIEPYVQALKGE